MRGLGGGAERGPPIGRSGTDSVACRGPIIGLSTGAKGPKPSALSPGLLPLCATWTFLDSCVGSPGVKTHLGVRGFSHICEDRVRGSQ